MCACVRVLLVETQWSDLVFVFFVFTFLCSVISSIVRLTAD